MSFINKKEKKKLVQSRCSEYKVLALLKANKNLAEIVRRAIDEEFSRLKKIEFEKERFNK